MSDISNEEDGVSRRGLLGGTATAAGLAGLAGAAGGAASVALTRPA